MNLVQKKPRRKRPIKQKRQHGKGKISNKREDKQNRKTEILKKTKNTVKIEN